MLPSRWRILEPDGCAGRDWRRLADDGVGGADFSSGTGLLAKPPTAMSVRVVNLPPDPTGHTSERPVSVPLGAAFD